MYTHHGIPGLQLAIESPFALLLSLQLSLFRQEHIAGRRDIDPKEDEAFRLRRLTLTPRSPGQAMNSAALPSASSGVCASTCAAFSATQHSIPS